MKKLTSILTLILIATLSFTFTSCDDNNDYDEAATLNGIWQGSLGSAYYDQYGSGYDYQETEFRFYNDGDENYNSTSGTGTEIDYNPNNYQAYTYYDFRWNIAYGVIYLYYSNGDNLVIRDYSLSGSRLHGYLETTNGQTVAELDLEKTSYWPWSNYAKQNNFTIKRMK